MTMDGNDADWGWYDNDFALSTPPGDDFWSPEGQVTDPEDYQATLRFAYSRPPDNRLYFLLQNSGRLPAAAGARPETHVAR